MEPKKLLFLLAGAVVLLGVAIFLAFRSGSNIPATPTLEATKIIEESVSFPYSPDGKTVYFVDSLFSKFARRDASGQVTYLSGSVQFPDQVSWSPDGSGVIFSTLNMPSVVTENPYFVPERPFDTENFWLLNFGTGTLTLLKENLRGIAWLPPGQKIVYSYRTGESLITELVLANSDGSQFDKLRDVASTDVWIAGDKEDGYVFASSTSTDQVIVSTVKGEEKKISFPRKMNLAKSALAKEGQAWAHVVVEGSRESVYLFDASTQQETRLRVKDAPSKIDEVTLIPDGKVLYFTSDGTLYRVDLP